MNHFSSSTACCNFAIPCQNGLTGLAPQYQLDPMNTAGNTPLAPHSFHEVQSYYGPTWTDVGSPEERLESSFAASQPAVQCLEENGRQKTVPIADIVTDESQQQTKRKPG